MKIILTLALIAFTFSLKAQNSTEEIAVRNTINQFFEGMKKADSSIVKAVVATEARLETIARNKEGEIYVKVDGINAFIKAISTPHPEIYDERLNDIEIKIDAELATVWAPYQFYIGQKFSHCGVNTFTLVKIEKNWKIWYIIDTRRKENCK